MSAAESVPTNSHMNKSWERKRQINVRALMQCSSRETGKKIAHSVAQVTMALGVKKLAIGPTRYVSSPTDLFQLKAAAELKENLTAGQTNAW